MQSPENRKEATDRHDTKTAHDPWFEAGPVRISHLTSAVGGLAVNITPERRTAGIDTRNLTDEDRKTFQKGIQNEMKFAGVDKLRTARAAWRNAIKQNSTNADELKKLKDAFYEIRQQYQNKGKKLGFSDLNIIDGEIKGGVHIAPYPFYNSSSKPGASKEVLRLSMASGVAMAVRTTDGRLVIQHRAAETPKLDDTGTSPGNASYANIPGASVAGMLDATLSGSEDRQPGTPDAVDTDTIKSMILKEASEELGINGDMVESLRIVGVAQDGVKPHDEFMLFANLKMTAAELEETSRMSNRNKYLDDIDMAEKFIDIPANSQAIETLLCDVKCPLPPTHAATLVSAGYLMVLEKDGESIAREWLSTLEPRIAENYALIDKLVQQFYLDNPAEASQIPERFWSKNKDAPKRNINGYDPAYTPEEQGLPSFEDEMIRTGLLPETRTEVNTAYLFDVDGVLTNPETKKAHPFLIEEILDRLAKNEPVCLNTGRSVDWVLKHVIDPLKNSINNRSLDTAAILNNLIIVGEKGATWHTFNNSEGGINEYTGQVKSLSIPPELKQEVAELIEKNPKYKAAMSIGTEDPDKLTMLSPEMNNGYPLGEYTKIQQSFADELQTILDGNEKYSRYKIDATGIAVDIESPHVSKALGAQRFMEFLKLRGFVAKEFITFGDSASDLTMADYLSKIGKDVTMVFVGNKDTLENQAERQYTVTLAPGYDKGTVDFFFKRAIPKK